MMIDLASAGRNVVRLKGGDPLVFGRAGEEIAACRTAGISVEIVPGITAAQAGAAALGISLTDRRYARRMQYVTGHSRAGALPDDIDWAQVADADAMTAIYMPRRTLGQLSATAIAHGLDPATPAAAVAGATRPDEAIVTGTIADISSRLEAADPHGPVIVFFGRGLAESARMIGSTEAPLDGKIAGGPRTSLA